MGDCKYCYYNTVLNCCDKNHDKICEEYEENHLSKKYENTRFKLKWVSHPCNDYLIMEDSLHQFSDWSFECLEDGEELCDFLNGMDMDIQDLEDLYTNAILNFMDENIKLIMTQKGFVTGNIYAVRINLLLELLEETGNDSLIEDFYDKFYNE